MIALIAEKPSVAKGKVEPVTSAEYAAANPASASRPAWSALENRMLRCTVGDEKSSLIESDVSSFTSAKAYAVLSFLYINV